MQATMESIRASLQGEFGDGDLVDARDFAAAFEEIDNAGSLLRRLVGAYVSLCSRYPLS